MSPWRSRTHMPSLRSMAGNRIMKDRVAVLVVAGLLLQVFSYRSFVTGFFVTDLCACKGTAPLRRPFQEIRNQPQPQPLALFRMELGAHRGIARHDGGNRPAVVGVGDQL